MKLSDRLTRAGLVFILLGTTAALLPEDGLALACAGDCPSAKCVYELKAGNCTYTNGQVYCFPQCGSGLSIQFYAYESCNGASFKPVNITSVKSIGIYGSVAVSTSGNGVLFKNPSALLGASYIITFSDGGTETLYLARQ